MIQECPFKRGTTGYCTWLWTVAQKCCKVCYNIHNWSTDD